jgi:HK97 family phage prohead protease
VRKRTRKLPLAAEGRELRLASFGSLEVRFADDGAPIPMRGTAAVFNKRALIGGRWGWVEQIAPGAFDRVLEDDVRMLKNHNPDLVLARTTAGNLRLRQTSDGLETEAEMTPTTYARDLALSMQAGDVTQMSFAFEVAHERWDELGEDDPDFGETAFNEIRTITEIKRLYDVSPVTYPAYVDTDASLRMRELRAIAEGLGLDEDGLHELANAVRSGRDLRELIGSRAWDGSSSRFTDEQWKKACAACEGKSDAPKTDCYLPHHDPDGTLNPDGLAAAAGRFPQTDRANKDAAKAHLADHYKELGKEVPESLRGASAHTGCVSCHKSNDVSDSASAATPAATGLARGNRERISQIRRKVKVR